MNQPWPKGVKRVSASLQVGPYGQPVHMPGYFEIAGVRLYDDEFVVGQCGLPELRRGRSEFLKANKPSRLDAAIEATIDKIRDAFDGSPKFKARLRALEEKQEC